MTTSRTPQRDRQMTIGIDQVVVDAERSRVGTVERVVCHPTLSWLTHVIVRPDRISAAKLVPIESLSVVDGELTLDEHREWPDGYEDAETVELLPLGERLAGDDLTWPVNGALVWPYLDVPSGTHTVVHDHLPLGEVAVGIGAEVTATDGSIGRIAGFVVHPDEQTITHVVLRHGHLWGRKTMLIPVDKVRASDEGRILHVDAERSELDAYVLP